MTTFNQHRVDLGMPTLGHTLRGLRHGYKWLSGIGGFLRISRTEMTTVFRIELMPCGPVDKSHCTGDYHVAWWKDEDFAEIKLMIKPLINIVKVKRRVIFYVNEEGDLV